MFQNLTKLLRRRWRYSSRSRTIVASKQLQALSLWQSSFRCSSASGISLVCSSWTSPKPGLFCSLSLGRLSQKTCPHTKWSFPLSSRAKPILITGKWKWCCNQFASKSLKTKLHGMNFATCSILWTARLNLRLCSKFKALLLSKPGLPINFSKITSLPVSKILSTNSERRRMSARYCKSFLRKICWR